MNNLLPDSTSILMQLRAATKPAHRQLEAALNLLDPQLSRQDYKEILMRFHGFWQGWQPLIARLMADPDFTLPRQRLHMLAEDLSAMGMSQAAIESLPACPMPDLQNAASALGSLYVMEGSTLGGRIIEKNLLVNLRIARTFGASYFAGYGEANGQMWRDFLIRLAAAPLANAAQINLGASATFASLTNWLAVAA